MVRLTQEPYHLISILYSQNQCIDPRLGLKGTPNEESVFSPDQVIDCGQYNHVAIGQYIKAAGDVNVCAAVMLYLQCLTQESHRRHYVPRHSVMRHVNHSSRICLQFVQTGICTRRGSEGRTDQVRYATDDCKEGDHTGIGFVSCYGNRVGITTACFSRYIAVAGSSTLRRKQQPDSRPERVIPSPTSDNPQLLTHANRQNNKRSH